LCITVAPEGLILYTSDAVEGEVLNFKCESRGAKPISVYEYRK